MELLIHISKEHDICLDNAYDLFHSCILLENYDCECLKDKTDLQKLSYQHVKNIALFTGLHHIINMKKEEIIDHIVQTYQFNDNKPC